MATLNHRSQKHTERVAPDHPAQPWESWLTRAAFGLSLAIVLTRATMLELLRDPLDIAPGSQPVPRGAGPATGLVLDLLAWVPSLLVLARATLDRAVRVRISWATALMLALGSLAVLSALWAEDKFAALVSGFHWLSAAVFLWSASQLVNSWQRLRLVAGVCVALLLIYAAQAFTYKYVELAELRADWQKNGQQHLRDRGFEPGSFSAVQFENKVLRGEMIGFGASSNTFAAVAVLLMVVAGGVFVQRLADGDGPGWAAVPGTGLGLGLCIVVWSDSKTAYATPILAAGILATLAIAGGWLARHAKAAYFAGVSLVALGAAAVIGHGLHHGSLVIDSMTFRWRYWLGAARVVTDHPLLGVGWDNFGLHYLSHRLANAAEEIRDPHNFLVKFLAELGLLGGLLGASWMLRLWWELTRPRALPRDGVAPAPRALPAIVAVAAAGTLLSILAFVDVGFMNAAGPGGSAYVFLRVMERFIGAFIVVIGVSTAALRSLADARLDDRPAKWVHHSMLAGFGVFLVHNLVDFSMFEIGPMFLFALLAGSALGVRQAATQTTPVAAAPTPARWRVAALAGLTVAWLAGAAGLAVPVVIAEEYASDGDDHLRRASPAEAARAYETAASMVPYNADYWFRAARVLSLPGAPLGAWRAAIDAAVSANPAQPGYFASRARLEADLPQPDAARVRADFARALELDPANVTMRRDFALTLEKLGFPDEAREQYERALWFNDQLLPDDAERLPPKLLDEIRDQIRRLSR